MFSGIILIAIVHGMILAPAMLGECRFIYQGIGAHRSKRKWSNILVEPDDNMAADGGNDIELTPSAVGSGVRNADHGNQRKK